MTNSKQGSYFWMIDGKDHSNVLKLSTGSNYIV